MMAWSREAGRVFVCSRSLLVFVVVQLLFGQLKPHSNDRLSYIVVGGGYDVKPIHSTYSITRLSARRSLNF